MKKLSLFLLSMSVFFINLMVLCAEEDLSKRIQQLVNQLNSTVGAAQQNNAKNQLVKMGREALPSLEKYIRDDKRTYVRVQIAFVLGQIKDESSIPILVKTGGSRYFALNKACAIALGTIPGNKAVEALKRLKAKTRDNNLVKVIDQVLARKIKN